MTTQRTHLRQRFYDEHHYRVWPDGTVQDADEPTHSHMSDDYATVWAYCDAEAAERYAQHVAQILKGTPTTDSTRAAMVDKGYHWRPITPDTPRGTKLQLISRPAGVAVYGNLSTDPGHWTHYAPLPTFNDAN